MNSGVYLSEQLCRSGPIGSARDVVQNGGLIASGGGIWYQLVTKVNCQKSIVIGKAKQNDGLHIIHLCFPNMGETKTSATPFATGCTNCQLDNYVLGPFCENKKWLWTVYGSHMAKCCLIYTVKGIKP